MLLDGGQRRRSRVAADAEWIGARWVHRVDVGDAATVEVRFQQLGQPTRGTAYRFVVHITALENNQIVFVTVIHPLIRSI